MTTEQYDTLIIGGGQAGLSTAYHLTRRGQQCMILEAHDRIGDIWRQRFDSLRLYSPSQYDGLPGWAFPVPRWTYPTKDQLADYLEAYEARFELPVRTGVRVESLTQDDDRYVVRAGDRTFEAAAEHRTVLSGPIRGELPMDIEGRMARMVLPFLWFAANHVLTRSTPMGRKMQPEVLAHGGPLLRVKTAHLAAAGVEHVPERVTDTQGGLPVLESGRVLDVRNVVWCTGFGKDLPWIQVPFEVRDGWPVQERGVVPSRTGLYFVGLPFLYAFASMLVGGVGRDAERVAAHIGSRARSAVPA